MSGGAVHERTFLASALLQLKRRFEMRLLYSKAKSFLCTLKGVPLCERCLRFPLVSTAAWRCYLEPGVLAVASGFCRTVSSWQFNKREARVDTSYQVRTRIATTRVRV